MMMENSGDTLTEIDTLTEAFAVQIRKTPDHIAVSDERRQLSYRELDQLSDTIADLFPCKAEFIGVVMDHSVEMIATLLAILKTGAAYVPAEPSFPFERIRYMMVQSGASFVVTQQQYAHILEAQPVILIEKGIEIDPAAEDASGEATPDALAYVLYTSGTTGRPKGVAVEHRNVCNYVRAFQGEFKPGIDDVMLQNSVCTFDIFVEEVFPILLSGGTLVIPDAFTRNDFSSLLDFIKARKVSIISGFPYFVWDFNKLDELPADIRLIISGGDVLKQSYVSNLVDKVELYNTYGPTETTVCATYFRCNGYKPLDDGTYPVGKAIAGVSFQLLDESLHPVSEGEVGEICIFGKGVSRGYLNDPEHMSAFVHTQDGQRFYRSGDLGRMLPDGNLDFLKRNDEQVMIFGKRVEPQEVELVLEQSEYVDHAAVTTGIDETGLAYMTAYIVPASRDVHVSSLRTYLLQYIPEYMVPEFFVLLREMPLTPNGKVDRLALPVVMKGRGI